MLVKGMKATRSYQLAKLQRVRHAAARLIFEETKFCHITSVDYTTLAPYQVPY